MRRAISFIAMLVLGACGYAAVDGDNLVSGENLPKRNTDDLDASVIDSGGTTTNNPIADSGAPDTQPPPPPKNSCAIANKNDLALCLTFESNTTDQSAAPITPKTIQNITFVPGKEGLAAVFVADSALRFDPNAAFDLPQNGATIEAWLKRQNAGADAVVFDDDGRFSLTVNLDGHVWCKSSGGAIIGTKTVPIDQWAHVACVIDNGKMTAYVNGVVDIEGAGSVLPAPTLAAAVGGNSPDGEPWIGLIDSFRVFKVARTAAEIADAAKP